MGSSLDDRRREQGGPGVPGAAAFATRDGAGRGQGRDDPPGCLQGPGPAGDPGLGEGHVGRPGAGHAPAQRNSDAVWSEGREAGGVRPEAAPQAAEGEAEGKTGTGRATGPGTCASHSCGAQAAVV